MTWLANVAKKFKAKVNFGTKNYSKHNIQKRIGNGCTKWINGLFK